MPKNSCLDDKPVAPADVQTRLEAYEKVRTELEIVMQKAEGVLQMARTMESAIVQQQKELAQSQRENDPIEQPDKD